MCPQSNIGKIVMDNSAHNITSRINVSLDEYHDELLIRIRAQLEKSSNKRISIAEIFRLALRTLEHNI